MNKKVFLAVGAVIIVLLVGSLIVLGNKSGSSNTSTQVQEQTIATLPASEIGLSLKPGTDNHRVVMGILKTDGIQTIEYQLSWTSKGDIPRGAIGKLDFTPGKPATKELYLGTCSDVCHPDSDVSDIKVIVKITKDDGKVYQSEATTSLK